MDTSRESSFGAILQKFRKRRRLSQQELASELGIHRTAISRWELGHFIPNTRAIVGEIATVLQLDDVDTRVLLEAFNMTASAIQVQILPYLRNPFFIDREEVLQQLHERLAGDKKVAVTQVISGLGGVGKTQVALEYAYRYRNNYHDILWASADSHESLMGEFVKFATLLNLPEKNEKVEERIVEAVKRWLDGHRGWLLILDNIEDPKLDNQFIPTAQQGAIILTTRRQVSESFAMTIELEVLSDEKGALFLLKRARLIDLYGSLEDVSPADRTIARLITQTLGGLPLALDQAGAYIEETGCSLANYLDLHQTQNSTLLKNRGGAFPDHPTSVTMTFSLAFKKVATISPAAIELLRLLAFLAPDAIPEEIITIGATHLGSILQPIATDKFALNKVIEALRTFSLINRELDRNTVSIHPLVQAVLRDAMDYNMQYEWVERTTRVLNEAFPTGEMNVEQWPHCEQLLPHVLECTTLSKQWNCVSSEAFSLLTKTARYLSDRARYAEAEPLLQRALQMQEQLLGSDHPDTAVSLNNLAALYCDQGRYAEAEPLFRRALWIREKVLGPDHPQTATNLNNLAALYCDQGRYAEAEPLFRRALWIHEQTLGPDHPDTAICLNNLAELYRTQAKYTEAEALFRRVITIFEKSFGPVHPHISAALNNLASVLQARQDFERAETLYYQALKADEMIFGPNHPIVATDLNNLASLFYHTDRLDIAEDFYRRALFIDEQSLGVDHPILAVRLNNLASLLLRSNRITKARELLERADGILEKNDRENLSLRREVREKLEAVL